MRPVIRRLGDICIRRRYLFFRIPAQRSNAIASLRAGNNPGYTWFARAYTNYSSHANDSLVVVDLDDGMGP